MCYKNLQFYTPPSRAPILPPKGFSPELSESDFTGQSYQPILVLPKPTGRHIKLYSSTSVASFYGQVL